MTEKSPQRIGDILLGRGLITRDQLMQAVVQQNQLGGKIGRHLILNGAITRRELYSALADAWDTRLVDLDEEPPNRDTLRGVDWTQVNERGWLPWRKEGETLWIATSVPPTPAVLAAAAAESKAASVKVVATTDWDITHAVQKAFEAEIGDHAVNSLAEDFPSASARSGLTWWQRQLPIVVAIITAVSLVISPSITIIVLFAASNLLFAINVGFKVICAIQSPFATAQVRTWERLVRRERLLRGLETRPAYIPDAELPIYTILVPAYREANVVEEVIEHMGRLNYPKAKLDVIVLLEEDDASTLAAAKAAHPPEYVRILVVPPGYPQTKPRACNYGLAFARGTYVVIFDAEDRPAPNELMEAVAEFRRADFEHERHGGPKLGCIQAPLNYFNADYNVLTRMFAIEYAHWFDMMLPGMASFDLPIPLGGTSNHFRADVLRKVGAWDPFNVTEDADLGIRLDTAGYRTGVIPATTLEEATSRVGPWIRQRTRWIKGYMMTAAVNLRHPGKWSSTVGIRGMITMFGLIVSTPLSFMAYPLTALLTVATYVGFGVNQIGIPQWLIVTGWLNMLGSTLAMTIVSGAAAWHRYSWRVGLFAVFNPIYWFLHAIAAWRAAWQILRDPFHWEKTPHGLSGDYESETTGATNYAESNE